MSYHPHVCPSRSSTSWMKDVIRSTQAETNSSCNTVSSSESMSSASAMKSFSKKVCSCAIAFSIMRSRMFGSAVADVGVPMAPAGGGIGPSIWKLMFCPMVTGADGGELWNTRSAIAQKNNVEWIHARTFLLNPQLRTLTMIVVSCHYQSEEELKTSWRGCEQREVTRDCMWNVRKYDLDRDFVFGKCFESWGRGWYTRSFHQRRNDSSELARSH